MVEPEKHHHNIILFYKYHALSPDFAVTEMYRTALETLCRSLQLTGRILVGCSATEGINGTLAGRYENVRAFTRALLKEQQHSDNNNDDDPSYMKQATGDFWKASEAFFQSIGEPELCFDSPDDFKWSSCSNRNDELFPDLNIKLVSELIGTGGVLSSIPLGETAKGYLTPREWHDRLSQQLQDDDTVLIDCRNTKEYEIGRFVGATDPKTTTFSQFPKWVEDNKVLLEDKKVMMYCTGGIRCEKVRLLPILSVRCDNVRLSSLNTD
jgi:predicted sulfurtransferase